MNYAKTQPELVILAVNTFVKDTDDPNPLVRALAIRTMGCLRAEKIIDYLCDPLQKCLRDENPYVRKTAALCVAKLYDLKPELVIDNGFLEQLQEMIADSNPMVRASLYALQLHSRLMFRKGRRQYCRGVDRYSHCRYITAWDVVLGPWNFQYHHVYPQQTIDRPQRVFRMGSCGNPQCLGPICRSRREGERTYMRTCGTTIPTRKRKCCPCSGEG